VAGDIDVSYAVQLEEIRGNIKLILSNQERETQDRRSLSERVNGHSNRFQLLENRLNATDSKVDNKFSVIDGERKGVAAAFRVMYILWGAFGGGSLVAGVILFVIKAKGA
jgi:hypothetical protein